MSELNYVCPYCGKPVGKDNVLFWEKSKTQYTDRIRGEFLRRHGVIVPDGFKFPRVYYRVSEANVIRADETGFPTMLEDHVGNAIAPADLDKAVKTGQSDNFDDDFDSDGFDDGSESRAEKMDRTLHNIPLRACPHCHCELPQLFGALKTYHVAMFGGRAAGKTAYLVNLFQQLTAQLSENNLGSVTLEKESAGFLDPMINDYEQTGTTRPTPAEGGLLPILCHYKNGNDEAFITFYDIAGEGTNDPAYMANHEGIKNCEALMLMIDPNMFVGGAFATAWYANHLSGMDRYGEGGDCCRDPLDKFLTEAGSLCHEYSDKIRYIICVVTKMDMLLEAHQKYFAAGDIEITRDIGNAHFDGVNLQTLRRVHDNIGLYMQKNYHIDLKQKILDAFGSDMRVNLLGVSTSTLSRGEGGGFKFEPRSAAVDRKHRIIEPFLIVLMRFGLIDAKKADDSNPGTYIKVRFNDKNVIQESASQQSEPEQVKKEVKRGLFGWRKNK